MNNLIYFIKKYNLEVVKITKIGDTTIIDTDYKKYVFKKENIKTYDYLLSKGFNYFPNIIDYNNEFIMFDYIENIDYNINEKIEDYIKTLSLLHLKTCYYENINNLDFDSLYNEINLKIKNVTDYYNNLINVIESKEYMSPAEYLVARNITNIYSLLNYSSNNINKWHKSINNKKRVVTLYNNGIDKMLKSKDGIYFTDFKNIKTDLPIYDLYNLFNRYYDIIDFKIVLNKYEKIFKLTEEEKELLFIMISIPEIIIVDDKIKNIFLIKKQINKIYILLNLLYSEKEEGTSTHETKDN